jgi:hypothetical protein
MADWRASGLMVSPAAPTPQSRRWLEAYRRRRRSPLFRRIDRSFRLRLLLAALVALAALVVVNRWEHCRQAGWGSGCLWRDAGGVVTVANMEAFSIVTAGVLYVLEGGRRRQREHYEALELILMYQQAGVRTSHARSQALELLSEAGFSPDGLDLSGIDLEEIQLAGARWPGVNLAGSSLRGAVLRGTDLRGAHLHGADFQGADLRAADLQGADLRDADLGGADLRDADLRQANLAGARLEGARLTGARWEGASPDG